MKSEEDINRRVEMINAEIENIDKKQHISIIDAIHKRDLLVQEIALRWCLKRSRSSQERLKKSTGI